MTAADLKLNSEYLLRSTTMTGATRSVRGRLKLMSANRRSLAFELSEPMAIRIKGGGMVVTQVLPINAGAQFEDLWGGQWDIVGEAPKEERICRE